MHEARKSLVLLTLMAAVASAQTPGIASLSDGQITFTNISTNLEYRLQWSATAPGTNALNENFNNIEYVSPTGTSVTLPLPLYYNIGATNALSNNILRAHEHPFGVRMGTNAKASLEWSENYGGPWSTTWNAPLEVTPTGTVANAPTPHYFRITFVNCPSNFHGCFNWSNATPDDANRAIRYGSGKYYETCLVVRVGQTVTFSNLPPGATFAGYPLTPACQDYEGGITNISQGQVANFIFTEPGYFGYYAQNFGDINGNGMAGNIQVVP